MDKPLDILTSCKSDIATISVFLIEPNLFICPRPQYPTPINAILILSNLGAIKSPIYFPFD